MSQNNSNGNNSSNQQHSKNKSTTTQHPYWQPSQGLTVYPTAVAPAESTLLFRAVSSPRPPRSAAPSTPPAVSTPTTPSSTLIHEDDHEVPDYHRSVARSDGREDADYYSDVENLTSSRSQAVQGLLPAHADSLSPAAVPANAWGFMIRLTAESTAFYQGAGWRAYDHYIGSRILYPQYTDDIKRLVFESAAVQACLKRLTLADLRGVLSVSQLTPPRRQADLSLAEYRRRKREHQQNVERYAKKWEHVSRVYQKRAKTYLDTLCADLSSKNVARFMAFVMNQILVRMYRQGIHIKEGEFMEVRKAALEAQKTKTPMVFLPCHKSHVDYLVISYIFYRLGIALPHIAAGDNLNLPFVGSLLQHGGAFFIRRSFGDDPLYQEIVKEYITTLLKRGHNIEVFIEGTRSRIGKLLTPKFGILKIILDAVLDGHVDDCILVPMSIDYDKVIETATYVDELMGSPKEKESLAQVVNSASLLSLNLGRIDIRFAKPMSLRQYVRSEMARRSTATTVFSPVYSLQHKSILLQALGYRILSDINSVSVVMPTALVGTVLLTLRGRGVGQSELVRRVTWLRREILLKGGRVADFGGMPVEVVVTRAVAALHSVIGVRKELLEPVFYATKPMYATIKKGQTHRRIPFAALLQDVVFLSKLLKSEFIFQPGSIEDNMEKTLSILQDHRIVDVEWEDGQIFDLNQERLRLPELRRRDYFVKLSDKERSIGRENFDFYCFLIWPFVETYWLAAAGLFSMIPTPVTGGITEKVLMDRIQHFGRTLYYEGDLGYFEAINKETLKHAILRYEDMGWIARKTIKVDPLPVESESSGSKSVQSTVVLWAVDPKYEEEASKFLNQPLPELYSTIYKFNQSESKRAANNPKQTTIYQTQLWDFVEHIGKYRREGKHRRDNETTGKRTLRLARMARAVAGDSTIAKL